MKKALIPLVLASMSLLGVTIFVSFSEKALAHVGAPAAMSLPPERNAISEQGFEIEVLVNGIPLPEYYARGRRYVEALENAEYELRIRNPLGRRVAVALSVDGLNTIDARRTSAANASKWVIEPYGAITISGWQMSSERARRFYFTNERNSYGAKLGQTSNLGVISAVFFRERNPVAVMTPPRRPRPLGDVDSSGERSEAPTSGAGRDGTENRASARQKSAEAYPAPDDDYAATGIGRNMRHDVRWVNLDLEDRPSAEVTLRYEYRAALVRLGVSPRPYPYQNADTLRRRERARGFEDRRYSPEP
jgi:hypothetical protein